MDANQKFLKKLKGFKDKYRARKGKIRVQFFIHDDGGVEILDTDFRNNNSY